LLFYLTDGVELVAVLNGQLGKRLKIPLSDGMLHLYNPDKFKDEWEYGSSNVL
jgi:hypothetical protein